MRKTQTAVITVLALMVVWSCLTTSVPAQGLRVGFIEDDRIQENYQAWGRAEEQMRIEVKAWEDEAVQMQTDLQDLIAEYDKQKLILSEEKRQEREAAIRVKRDALDNYTKRIFGPGGDAERRQDELIRPLIERVNEAIRQFAETEGYDIIFTGSSALGYVKPSFDVTDKVLEYLDRLED